LNEQMNNPTLDKLSRLVAEMKAQDDVNTEIDFNPQIQNYKPH